MMAIISGGAVAVDARRRRRSWLATAIMCIVKSVQRLLSLYAPQRY